jgi:hypothetical protein
MNILKIAGITFILSILIYILFSIPIMHTLLLIFSLLLMLIGSIRLYYALNRYY